MQESWKRNGRNRRGEHAHREDGREIPRHQVLALPLVSKVGGGIILLVLASCTPSIISEEGSIAVHFCPGNCEELFINFTEPENSCAFYDLDPYLYKHLGDDEVLVFEENHQGFGKKAYSRGLMHNKFCIYDNQVMTGSANPTERGFNTNYNNILVIESKTIAGNYREEFEELKSRGSKKTRHTMINLSGVLVENYFCPEDSCEEQVLEELEKSRKSIYFMTFTFTSDAIGNLLLQKSETIKVSGLMDSFGFNRYSEYEKLKHLVKVERTDAILHHKVFIIDKKTVITGSYNPTKAATERNDENIIIIHDQEIARLYLEEFSRLGQTF